MRKPLRYGFFAAALASASTAWAAGPDSNGMLASAASNGKFGVRTFTVYTKNTQR